MAIGKYKNLSGNIILFSISSFGHKILAFLLIPLYTRFLSPEQYGTIDLIGNTVNLLLPIFTLNISEAVMRFTIDDRQNNDYLSIGLITILKGLCPLTFLLMLLHFFPTSEIYKPYCGWIIVLYIANSAYVLGQNYLRATEHIPVMVTASLINSTTMLMLNVILIAGFRSGINGYYTATLSGLVMAFIFMEYKVKIHKHIRFKNIDATAKKDCYAYCIPSIFTALAWWANSGIDRYYVTAICGLKQNGIYSMAYKIPTILGIFQNIFNQAWMLSAITEFDRDDTDGFFGKTYELYNSMMIFATSGIMLFNILLSKILYANEFFDAWKYVPILLISSLFSALSGYMGSVFAAVKDTRTCAYTVIVSAVINIMFNTILIPVWGVWGAAIATALSYIMSWGMRMVVARKYIKMKIHLMKDLMAYIFLIVQMIFSLSKNHLYIGQMLLLLCLVGIYFNNYNDIFTHHINVFKKGEKGRVK